MWKMRRNGWEWNHRGNVAERRSQFCANHVRSLHGDSSKGTIGESTFCLQQASTQHVLDNLIRLGAFLAGDPHSVGATGSL